MNRHQQYFTGFVNELQAKPAGADVEVPRTFPLLRKLPQRSQALKNFPNTGENLLQGHRQLTYIAEQIVDLNYSYSQR